MEKETEAPAKVRGKPPVVAERPRGKAEIVSGEKRAPAGFSRFRVRGDHHKFHSVRYVLATTEADAKAEYVKYEKIKDAPDADKVPLVVLPMPD